MHGLSISMNAQTIEAITLVIAQSLNEREVKIISLLYSEYYLSDMRLLKQLSDVSA